MTLRVSTLTAAVATAIDDASLTQTVTVYRKYLPEIVHEDDGDGTIGVYVMPGPWRHDAIASGVLSNQYVVTVVVHKKFVSDATTGVMWTDPSSIDALVNLCEEIAKLLADAKYGYATCVSVEAGEEEFLFDQDLLATEHVFQCGLNASFVITEEDD